MIPTLQDIRVMIGERFYGDEMDAAFDRGMKIGLNKALNAVRWEVEYVSQDLTPARKAGVQIALDQIQKEKEKWAKKYA